MGALSYLRNWTKFWSDFYWFFFPITNDWVHSEQSWVNFPTKRIMYICWKVFYEQWMIQNITPWFIVIEFQEILNQSSWLTKNDPRDF